MTRLPVLALALSAYLLGQTASKSVMGTVSAFRPDSAEIEVKPEAGNAQAFKVSGSTITKKIAPGQTDLAKAETISITDIAAGDRVLVTTGADQTSALRIIVIPATDLAKRDSADKLDWQKRGVSGVVTAVTGNEVAVEMRSLGGAAKYTIATGPKTSFMRYAPDSVKYADAKKSSAAEVAVGDQIRARGQKNADGTRMEAENVVFGTFLSRAGTITAVNAASQEITVKDLATNKPVVIRFTADSQIKRMPEAGAGPGAGRGPAAPPATPASPPAAPVNQGRGPEPAAGGPGRGAGTGPDIGQLLESLPPVKVEDLKPGEVIVVSAIHGAAPDRITAVTFLANAERLVQIAMQARGLGATGPAPSLAGLASSISSVGP